jgi:adenylate cyclase
VDDDDLVRSTIAAMIEREGYIVLEAETADQAITIARTSRIDAFLLDMEMPKKSGMELCRNIRAMDAYKVTPILFVTGAGEQSHLAGAFAAGCDDFINKPVDAVILRGRLKGHLDRLSYYEELERARQELNHYLSKRTREVVEAASRSGKVLRPEHRDVVVLFTDIRGFTALADEMEPEKLFSLLNAWLADQVDLVYEFGGYVDKFGGDGLMAVFDGEDKVGQSCLCALRMMESARKSDGSEGDKIRQLAIGIHVGNVVIGTIGSPEHLDYSAIGTTVNLAARLCAHADPMSIVASKAVRDAAPTDGRLHFHSEKQITVRGLKESVTVYALTEPGSPAN